MEIPTYIPPGFIGDIPASNNMLYEKHTVTVYPVNAISVDDVGGQKDSYGTPYDLVCNVQVSNVDPTDFNPARQGKLFTRVTNGVKTRDQFMHLGLRWRVIGIIAPLTNLAHTQHHLEADVEVVETSVV
jgi:hypothetical protein